jgi:hypothetical protein
MRLSSRAWVVLGAAVGLALIFATAQVVPAASPYQAQMRVWLAARASGIVTYLLLTILVAFGMMLSHPANQSTWKQSRRVFPWHEHLFVFVAAFALVHVVAIVLDPYAGVGITGAIVPGLSSYRSAPVALGSLSLYAALATALTARWTRLLPTGLWLRLHRLAALAWLFAWLHGMLAGTDTAVLLPMYLVTGLAVVVFASWRYWNPRRSRTAAPPRRTDIASMRTGTRQADAHVNRPDLGAAITRRQVAIPVSEAIEG